MKSLAEALAGSNNPPKTDEISCKGLIFSVRDSHWLSDRKELCSKRVVRYLKRKSCKGCGECDGMYEEIFDWGDEFIERISNFHDLKPGKFYTPKIVNITTDWETGYVDGYDIQFNEVEEPKS